MIRLYGTSIGNGSFARVTAGIRHGLSELGQLAGFVPVDNYDSEEIYEGHDAPTAVYIGDPSRVDIMTNVGWHERRFALLSANSTWMPEKLIRQMEEHLTSFIAPSVWAKGILERYARLPVSLFHHGVDARFVPGNDETLRASYGVSLPQGQFRVVHLSSSSGERKGTKELVSAFCAAIASGALPEGARLIVITDEAACFPSSPDPKTTFGKHVLTEPRRSLSIEASAELYRSAHLVCQPSRGEAFGMVPLEAMACGSVVAMTGVAGHLDYMSDGYPVYVPTGPMAPIDDGPCAMAPSLGSADVYRALVQAYQGWSYFYSIASEKAPYLRKKWSWEAVTRAWLDEVAR